MEERRHLTPLPVSGQRIGWTIPALFIVFTGIQLWTGSAVISWMNPASLAITLTGLLLVWRVWAAKNDPQLRDQALIMAVLVVGMFVRGYLEVTFNSSYGTDEVAFSQYAAELVLHGHNPYVHSMLPSLEQFLVPSIYHTYLLDGTPVNGYSYPALSFLLHVPALLLGLHMQAAVFTDLAFWALSCLLLWLLLPAQAAWAAGAVFSLTVYGNYVLGGVTDALFLPFCLLAVWRWDRFATSRGAFRFVGPVAIGLALSIKQTPWFLLPFLLVGIAYETKGQRGRRGWIAQTSLYLGVVVAVFAAVNAPFIIAAPKAWLQGSLLPLISPTVSSGQGLVNLSMFEHFGGRLHYYTLAGAAAAVLALLLYATYYRKLKRAWVPLVALVFFWPTRSFASYLIDLVPIALVAGSTVRPASDMRVPDWLRRVRLPLLVLASGVFVGAVALALSVPAPLEVKIVGSESTGQEQSIDGLAVQVRNRTGSPVRPHFTLVDGGYLTAFWYVDQNGRAVKDPVIGPHATRRLFLRAPNVQSMPSISGGYALEAFTAQPAAVSASQLVLPASYRLVLLPDSVERAIPVGQSLVLTAELVDLRGNPIDRAGVRVALGQVVYGQSAIIPGESSINGMPEGQTPVTELTDAHGQARFSVTGIQPQRDPTFFQSWVSPLTGTPHGYSEQVSLQFVARKAAAAGASMPASKTP